MPVKKCSNGKYRIGSGDCVYTSREKAERAQKAYYAQKEARQIIESVLMEAQLNKKSDWNAEQAVTRIQKSPLYRSTKGYQDPEEIRKTVLQNREKFEKKIYDKIFLPVNDSVVNLEQMFRESGSTVATYLSDNEKKLLQQFLEDLKELHDRFENSGIFSKDYL